MSNFNIEKLTEEYENKFSDGWLEKVDWSEDKEKESYLKCKALIDSYSELFFVTFSYSILSGEFLDKKDIIDGKIKEITQATTKEYGNPIEGGSVFNKKILEEFDVLNKSIQSACLEYKGIIKFYPSHYNAIHNNYRFRVYRQVKNTNSNNKISYFGVIVVEICKFDFYFENEDDSFKNLILLKDMIKNLLKKETSNDIINVFSICIEKIDFLVKKLLPYSGTSVYSIDFTDYQLGLKDIKLKNFDYLWRQYELFSCISSDATSVSTNPLIDHYQRKAFGGNIKFSELILLMRVYCKDKNSSDIQIRNIFELFDSKYNSCTQKTLHEFDKYALHSMRNLMYNCRLSYFLQQKSYTINSLKDDMEVIEDFQSKTGVTNYFHFQLAIEYLLKKAKEQISFDALKTIKELLNKYVVSYNKAISQCKKNGFYPLQLMFEECSFYIEDLRETVFIPSSFSQPVNYRKLEEKVDDYRIRCLQIENKLDLLKEQESINELKKNLETTTSKYIEIGGIFVAVLSLLFSVVSFTNTKMDVSDIALHSFGIGFILLMFVSCIYVLTLKRDCKLSEIFKSLRFWVFAFLLIISAIALYIIINHYSCI